MKEKYSLEVLQLFFLPRLRKFLMYLFFLLVNWVLGSKDIINNGSLIVDDDSFVQYWERTDPVDVYVGEYKLKNLTIATWLNLPASHIGLVLHNTRRNRYVIYDYLVRGEAGLPCLLIPSIIPGSGFHDLNFFESIQMYLRGDLLKYLEWTSDAVVHLRDDPPHDFNHMDYIGTVDGESVEKLRNWIINDYTSQFPFTYDVWSLYQGTSRIRSSKTCSDFVETCLVQLFGNGRNPITFYREGFLVNTTDFEPWIDMESSSRNRRDFQRYLRFFRNHIFEISSKFEFARILFSKISYFKLPLVLPLEKHSQYARFKLADYFIINYCRYPVQIIPGQGAVASELNDPRVVCFMGPADLDKVLAEPGVKWTFTDYSIWFEKIIDDFISSPILAIATSTLVIVVIAKFSRK